MFITKKSGEHKFKFYAFLYFSCFQIYLVIIHQQLAHCRIYTNISNNSIEHLTDESLLETMFLPFVHKVDLCTQVHFAIVINQCKSQSYEHHITIIKLLFFHVSTIQV